MHELSDRYVIKYWNVLYKNVCENCKFWNRQLTVGYGMFGICTMKNKYESFVFTIPTRIKTFAKFGCNQFEYKEVTK